MTTPNVTGPRDLPDLRDWMVRRYRPGGDMHWLDGDWLERTLTNAQLWWVEPEACDLLAEAAPSWPEESPLTVDDAPHLFGFAVLALNLEGTDVQPEVDSPVWVSAMAWGPTMLPPVGEHGITAPGGRVYLESEGRKAISVALFSRFDLDTTAGVVDPTTFELDLPTFAALARPPAELGNHLYTFIGRTDWRLGAPASEPVVDNATGMDPKSLASQREDRRLLAALWAIARTPVAHVVTSDVPRAAMRRAQRAGNDPRVRVLTLNPAPTDGEAREVSREEPHWRHRWIVTPHFVNQPYGPGQSLRKVILRGPYMKGPEGAPLIGGERVWRVRP